jgi:topoisomerase-4 subunit B
MDAVQLWDTTLNPDTRRLQPMHVGSADFADTVGLMTRLMGKGEAAARRELMEVHGAEIEVDV